MDAIFDNMSAALRADTQLYGERHARTHRRGNKVAIGPVFHHLPPLLTFHSIDACQLAV